MKITILGRGNAGCLSALHFSHYSDAEIQLLYDAETPTEYVGQASILELPHFLWESLGVDLYNNPFNSTIKSGILYENWGKKQDNIFHGFRLGTYGIHYDTKFLQNYILESLSSKIEVLDQRVSSYDEIDADYIIDCRGFPQEHREGKLGDSYDSLLNPLNSVLLANIDEDRSADKYTRAVATPDGWCFVIPLYDTVSLGYLYNSDITERDSAEKNFRDLFDVDVIKDHFSFQCFLAKEPIKDERIILNGNRLFFLEPLESTAVQTYITWNRKIFDWMISKTVSSSGANEFIRTYTKQIQNFILWHYHSGSKYDTPFWDYAKALDIDDTLFYEFLRDSKLHGVYPLQQNNANQYGQWLYWNFKLWEDGTHLNR